MKALAALASCLLSHAAFGQIYGAVVEPWQAHGYDLPITCQSERLVSSVVNALKGVAQQSGALAAQVSVDYAGKSVLSCGVGYNDPLARRKLATGVASSAVRLGPNTPQRQASITKFFVHVALQQLALAGKVSFSDNALIASGVKSYNGVVAQPGFSDCTIQKALDYMCQVNVNFAGAFEIEQKTGWKRPFTLEQQLSYDVGSVVNMTIGFGSYSNVAYGLHGKVIERASGMSMIDYIHQAVTRPVGIDDSGVQVVLGAYQMCADGKWKADQRSQFCTNRSPQNVTAGREPGEIWYDSTTTFFPSEYDNALAWGENAGRIENAGGAFGLVATPRTVLKLLSSYNKDGTPVLIDPFNLVGGFVTGSVVMAYREGALSVFVGFNRSNRENDNGLGRTVAEVAIETAFDEARKIDWSAYSDLYADSASRIQMRTYCHSTLNYCFLAGPLSAAALDMVPGWVRQTGEGDGFNAWAPDVQKNVYRYFHPEVGTHFFGTYDDAKLVTRFDPQVPLTAADGWSGFRYEAIEFSAKLPTGSVCEAGTVPVYRLFRSGTTTLRANHRYTTSLAFYNSAVQSGWSGEGAVFCS